MNKKTIVIVVILAVLVIGLTLYWQFFGSNSVKNQGAQVINSQQNQEDTVIVTGVHQFKGGRHIIAGEVDLPTPCHVLNHTVIVAESFPEQVTIAFETETDGSDLCAQMITSSRYKVEFSASENAVMKATWNGAPAQLNLIPAATGEDLNNFDVFIKA